MMSGALGAQATTTALQPIVDASTAEASLVMIDAFAQAAGILSRIRMFGRRLLN
jgi:hypothetical protein